MPIRRYSIDCPIIREKAPENNNTDLISVSRFNKYLCSAKEIADTPMQPETIAIRISNHVPSMR
jgi:hypothetical protein